MNAIQLYTDLTEYARLTAKDNECDVPRAVRMMRDEPGHVAKEIGCTERDVIDWCDADSVGT